MDHSFEIREQGMRLIGPEVDLPAFLFAEQ